MGEIGYSPVQGVQTRKGVNIDAMPIDSPEPSAGLRYMKAQEHTIRIQHPAHVGECGFAIGWGIRMRGVVGVIMRRRRFDLWQLGLQDRSLSPQFGRGVDRK